MPTLGIAPLLDAYFRRRFAAAGLVEASVPLDGGASLLVAAGIGFGIRKLRARSRR